MVLPQIECSHLKTFRIAQVVGTAQRAPVAPAGRADEFVNVVLHVLRHTDVYRRAAAAGVMDNGYSSRQFVLDDTLTCSVLRVPRFPVSHCWRNVH